MKLLLAASLVASFAFSHIAHAELSADDIVKKADEGRIPPGPMTIHVSVEDFEKQDKVREIKYKTYIKNNDASLVDTIFPERQQGRKLLMERDNLWLYTPDVKRAARVSMQQRLTGEIANGDLTRTNFAGDYKAGLVGKEDVDGKQAYHLKLEANREGVTYAKIDYWVTVEGYMPLKATFFALSGKAIKSATYSNPKDVMGHKRITTAKFVNAIDKGRYSVVNYTEYKKATIPDSFFSKERLGEQ